ncbi:uncharacterized protein LOC143911723 [Arctopsyche grandis]|uniref:uncharacterized protein LOC143911723 n=1 Tax=Arctopsyche grandis TaxID=121162 RepID=UPI00406D7AD8
MSMGRSGGRGAVGGSADLMSEPERRLLRLKQVREQSKEIAKKLRVKFNEEKNKQTTLVSNSKRMTFEKFKKDSSQSLKNKYESRNIMNMGNSQSALSTEENLKREWLTQKEYSANKALERGKAAFDSMHVKRTQGNQRNKLECKRWDSPRKSRSPTISTGNTNTSKKSSTDKINQFYEELDGTDNSCSNFQHHLEIGSNNQFPSSAPGASTSDSNPTFSKKRVTISGDFKNDGISSFPVKDKDQDEISHKYSEVENRHKSPRSEPKSKTQEQLSITDIQKALCDCQPHFKSVATNVEHLFNNNYKDKHVINPSEHRKKVTSRLITTDHTNKISKSNYEHGDINENAKFTPLTIVSDYLKNRDACFENEFTDNNDKKDIVESDFAHLEKAKDLIEHCRYLHSSGFIGDKKYSDYMKSASKDCLSSKMSKSPDILKRNFNRKSSTFNVKRTPIRNTRLIKPSPSKVKLKSSVSRWEFTSPHHSEKSINSYDQATKYSNKLFITDKYLVERLPREIHSAYENARIEAENEKAIAAAIRAARYNDRIKNRETVALERVEANDDYKNLLQELDAFTQEERLIGKTFPDKVFKNTVRIHDEINHQKSKNMAVKYKFHGNDQINAKTSGTNNDSEKLRMGSKFHRNSNVIISDQNDTAVNVATWDVSNNSNFKNKSDASLKGSESSVQSIVFQKLENSTVKPNHEEKITKIVSTDKIITSDENKIISNSPTKFLHEYSNSTEEEQTRKKIPKKSLKKAKLSSTSKRSLISNDTEIDNASSTTNTVSFEGLQIVIEVKKAKKETSKVKTSKTKNEEVQTVERFDSSSEVSIKTSKMVSKREVIFEKVNSQQRHDSSESTTYMSPPEKITTRLEKMFRREFPTPKDSQMSNSNVSHTSDLVMKNIAVNTDFILNDNIQITPRCEPAAGVANILKETSNFRKPSESLSSVNKGVQVDFVHTSKDLHSNVVIDTRLKSYVTKLLGMSENEIKKLNIDVSDIYTPNSSVINMPSNKQALARDVVDKVERLKTFIKENYALLEDFKKEESIVNSQKVKYIVKKPVLSLSESAIHNDNRKTITKLDAKSGSQPDLFKKDTELSPIEESAVNKKVKTKLSTSQSHPKLILKETIETLSQQSVENHSPTENKIDKNIRRIIPIEIEVDRKVSSIKSHKNSPSCLDDEDMFVILHHSKSDNSSENSKIKFVEPEADFVLDNVELDQLSDECTRRISDLSHKLDQVRREKRAILSSNASNSSEESSVPQNIAFVPMLDGIPKPSNDEDRMTQINSLRDELHCRSQSRDTFLPKLPEFNSNECQKAKPPLVMNNQSMTRNKDIMVTPHELSTIIEVDTPATVRNYSLNFPNVDASVVSAKLDNLFDFSNKGTGREKTPDKQVTPPNLSIPKLEDSVQVEANLNSFISFTDFIRQRRNETKLGQFVSNNDDSSSSDDSLRAVAVELLKQNLMSKKLKSGYSSSNNSSDNSSISEAILSNKSLCLEKTKSSFNDILKPKYNISGVHTLQTSSHSLTPELEKLIQSFGPDWGLATWKKTQEAQILSSSNSSLQMLFDKLDNETLGKTVDGTDNTGTLQDDLNLTDELPIKKNFIESTSDLSLYKKLEDLLKVIGKNQQKKQKESRDKILSDESIKEKRAIFKDQVAKSSTSAIDSTNIHSKDKTQHRTSTPVHFKSSTSSNTRNSSNNGSSGLFNADSDLSSVKNVSNCDKTVSDDRLSVPNVSLKFGKLFDSSTLDTDT